jgi:hypothetical protein
MNDDGIVKVLLDEALDLFFTSTRYDNPREERIGTASALAIAACGGKSRVFEMLLDEYRSLGSSLKYQIPASIADLLKNESINVGSTQMECCTQTVNYGVFSKPAQCSLREALYYAVECGNLDAAYELSYFGRFYGIQLANYDNV